MLAKDLASNEISALTINDTIATANALMLQHKISHIPVISDTNEFIGLFEENTQINTQTSLLSECSLITAESTRVYENQHFYSIFDIISDKKITIILVTNDKNNYVGCITQQRIIENLSKALSLQAQGGIIVLEVQYRDYSVGQIAQIIESNGAKILNLCTTPMESQELFEITIKINTVEISSIIETLLRYNYVIKSYFGEYNKLEDLYKSRVDELMKFLSI